MTSKDIRNIQALLTEKYEGEWVANIIEGRLPEGEHLGYQSGDEFRIGEHIAKLDHGIRGINFPHNARVFGNKIFISYVK